MHQSLPRVEGGRLYPSERSVQPLLVGTAAWYDWLEQHSAFTFVERTLGAFLARKHQSAAGEPLWEASRTQAGTPYRVVLGPSHTLTLAKLQSVAHTFASPHPPTEWAELPDAEPAASPSSPPVTAASVVSLNSLLRTKLYRPRSGSDVIPRARLLERLTAGLSGKATLLSAPAGFGKTTLVAAWLQALERPSAWLSLDAHDNELPVFVHVLIAALQSIWPDAFQATAGLLSAPNFPPPEHVVTLLLDDLADVPDDLVLVLDDYHLIHNQEVHTLLELLIDHLPPHVHLVLAARFDPPLPLVRWRARGQLSDLRAADLRFTLEETHAFLARLLGNTLAHESVVALEEETEGWIAVLRLAVLSLRSSTDRVAFLERLRHAPDRSVSCYLLEEILAQQAPFVQALLERTAILEQFCMEVCVALLGEETSQAQVQATLDWLEDANLFLVPLDERQGWYRLHHLFQGLLQQRLRERSSPEALAELHRRASAWYAGQGLLDEALRHALAAGDAREAARLVEAHFLWAFEQDQWGPMERWLRLLPEEQVQASPGLLCARAWVSWIRGQLQDMPPLLSAAEQLTAASGAEIAAPSDSPSRLLHALIAMFWSGFEFYTGQVQASLESGQAALERLRPGEEYVASWALNMLSSARLAAGQEEVALAELHQALRTGPARPAVTTHLLLAQVGVYLPAGKLPQGDHTARHVLRLAREAGLALTQHWAHWALGVVAYEWNQLEATVYHFSAVLADRHRAHAWAVQEALYGLALAYQTQGLAPRAHETTEALLDWVQGQHNLPQLLTTYAFCGELALLRGEVESAQQWLELAGEQEVLGSMDLLEDPPITHARLLLTRGDQASVAQGQSLLDKLVRHVEAIHNTRKTIKVLALQAWACELQGRLSEALDVLERALALARPGGFIRTFADLPQLARLLQEVRKRRKAQQRVDQALDAYLQRLLAAMRPGAAAGVAADELLRQEGLEPLTERERHILRLLDKDLSNKEIARELVVTPGTVKVHTNNLYRKLSVDNRRAAVTLAKALHLLPSE